MAKEPLKRERTLWLVRHVLPHEGALRTWLKRKAIGSLEIDDVVQETYAALAELESVDGIQNPKNYAFQVAFSIIVDHLRRSQIVSIQTGADVEVLASMIEAPSLERSLSDRDELRHVARAIGRLPDQCREAFVMRRVQDLPQREIAKRLRISENIVEKHISRAIRLLALEFGRGGKRSARPSKAAGGIDDEPSEDVAGE
jgi:RNA polymerase sigma-70 factor (ECF subfamily)